MADHRDRAVRHGGSRDVGNRRRPASPYIQRALLAEARDGHPAASLRALDEARRLRPQSNFYVP